MLHFAQGQNERIHFLIAGGAKRGCVWHPRSINRWCWSLHGDGEAIATGHTDSKDNACNSLLTAFQAHQNGCRT